MEFVVLSRWWVRYSHNWQLAIDVAGGGVGGFVLVLVVLVSGVVSQRRRPKKLEQRLESTERHD